MGTRDVVLQGSIAKAVVQSSCRLERMSLSQA